MQVWIDEFDRAWEEGTMFLLTNHPHIIERGVDWYSGLGHDVDTGTFLFSISGHVKKPGNYELPHGITWRQLIYEVAGGIRDDNELKAWVPGGASAPWFVPSEHLDIEFTKSVTDSGIWDLSVSKYSIFPVVNSSCRRPAMPWPIFSRKVFKVFTLLFIGDSVF